MAVMSVVATSVTELDVRTAATKFVTSDPVGSAIFSGRSVSGIRDADGLWIVSLMPAGHIIFSGSDLVEPVVGFSQKDFTDPDPESPACAMLDGARAASLVAETSGAGTRHAKWRKLLEKSSRILLRAGPVESLNVTNVPPFMLSCYDQLQPYNDYCPVYDSSTNTTAYRGRTPCGCVATSAAQVFRHFRWPARIDQTVQYNHSFFGTNGIETTFPIRFDGHIPIDWNVLDDNYIYWSNGYDLRGFVAESVRYPVARLVLWADVMAQMEFASIGSGANYDTVAANVTDWYTQGSWVDMQQGAELIKSDIRAGVPCHVKLQRYENGKYAGGHVAIAHGWAEDDSTQYAYINFGWGGDNDGYYNIADDFQVYQEKWAYVGHYPRAKPQLEPLPKICGPNITLNWHFPDFYSNNLSGFTVAVSKTATTPTTFLDNFSASEGVSSGSGISIREDVDCGYDGLLLCAEANAVGTYTFNGSRTLTSASVLTFKIWSTYANWTTYEIQASFNGGEWETISAPTLEMATEVGNNQWQAQQSFWCTERVYLGSHGGQTVRFRVAKGRSSTSYIPSGRICLDDFQVTNVLEQEVQAIYSVSAMERSRAFPRLDDGASYSFTVTPNISGALVNGETSDPVSVIVAGTHMFPVSGEQTSNSSSAPAVAWQEETLTDLGTPSILSVSNVVDGVAVYSVREGFYRECRYGMTNEFDVECSEHVTNLVAYSSHLALVGQGQITTRRLGLDSHTFRVSVDASGISEAQSRSRMILTLEAIDANGTKAYKDLSLRFSLDNEPLEVSTSATLPTAIVGELYSVALEATGGFAPYTWSAGYGESCSPNSFSKVGTVDSEEKDEDSFELTLPFDFPFYGSTYRTVYVNPNGALTFDRVLTGSDSWYPQLETFRSTAMIAVLWYDYVTFIAVDTNSADHVTIRWDGECYYDCTPVSFSATLYADGTICFRYGSGNTNGGMIGISSGNDAGYALSSESESGSMGIENNNIGHDDIIFSQQTALPPWLSLSPAGVLSGTPTTPGITSVGVLVSDSAGTPVGKTFNLTVEQPPLEVTTGMLPDATVGVPYSVTLEATGGVAPYTWSAATLPSRLSLSSAGVLSGTPTTSGIEAVTVFVTDGAGTQVGRTYNLTVGQPVAPLEITTSVLPPATSGVPYSVTLEATGGVGEYTWIGGDSYGYDSHSQSGSSFTDTTGTAMGWKANLGSSASGAVCWKLDLPFAFPFYGASYSNVWVSAYGTLSFDDYFDNWYSSTNSLAATKMIAAMWENIDTLSGDIYVEGSAESVTIRWSGVYWNTSDAVSFAATLYPDGRIRLSYGAGNVNGGCIGVSSGYEPINTLAAECSSESVTNSMNMAHDIVFTPWSPLPEWLYSLEGGIRLVGGVLSGTPTSAGTMSIHVYVMDEGVTEVGRTLNLTVEAAPAAAGWVGDVTEIPADTPVATQYPALADSVLATADAKEVTEWAATNHVDFAAVAVATSGTIYSDAFLLNCAPDAATVAEEEEDFVLDITFDSNGNPVVNLPEGKSYNGTLQMKGSNDLSTWTNVNGASMDYKFYKYELSL